MDKQSLVLFAKELLKAAGEGTPEKYVRHAGQTTMFERDAAQNKMLKKEAALTQALQSAAGLNKIAANMA